MDANHEQQLRLLSRNQGYDKSIAGSTIMMGTSGGAGFDESMGVPQQAADLRASTLPNRLCHSCQQFRNAWLVPPADQFQISARHVQGRDQPATSDPAQDRAG